MIIDVIDAEYLKDYKIKIKFENNKEGVADFQEFLKYEGVFSQLKDLAFFKKFYINKELGTICWPNGADIAPETLYEKIRSN